MPPYLIYALGFLAQALFASRMIVQWLQSEKAGRVVSPTFFWQTSLIASFLLLVYGMLRHDIIIVAGQSLSYFIYIRNLQLKGSWKQMPFILRCFFLAMPSLLYLWILFPENELLLSFNSNNDFLHPLMIIGTVGQLLMNFRFIYQWYHSERIHQSFFPNAFWTMSLIGSVLIIGYAIYRLDPVLLLANALGFIIYARNMIIGKNQQQTESI